jgi:hypothetical protein
MEEQRMVVVVVDAAEPVPRGRVGRQPAADPDRKLTLNLPASVMRQLKIRLAAEETTLRALVLEALAAAGYAVPAGEIRDRRRRGDGMPAA